VLKEADDDRMNSYAGPILKACFEHMTHVPADLQQLAAKDTKMLQVVIFCF
jgi:hypothetical protein